MKTIQDALDHAGNTHSVADVARQVLAGEAALFRSPNAGMVVEAVEYPLKKIARVWLAWGDLGEVVGTLQPQAEAWALEQGCTVALVSGRSGWVRKLKDFRPMAQVLTKELTP